MAGDVTDTTQVAEIGDVPRRWLVAPLSHFVLRVTYGFTNPMPTRDDGPFMVTAKDVYGGRIDYSTARRTSWDAYRNELTDKSRPRVGDVLLTKDGSIGRVAICDRADVCINQSVAVMQPSEKIDSRFLKYLLETPHYQHRMEGDSDGTTIKHIYITRVDKMEIAVPPIEEQRAIAHILGTLDDKIELNRRMNETLEAIARAIFKSWFVDFDPVRAKAEGRDTGSPRNINDLFPNQFERSALGEIPKGWYVRSLGEILDVKHGFAFGGEYFRDEPSGDILLTPGNFAVGGGFKEEKFKYYERSSPEEFVLSDGDLLVTMTDLSKAADTLGYPAIVPPPPRGRRFLHNQRLGKIVILNPAHVNKLFLYRLFCDESYRNEILAGATGTTVRHTSPSRIKAFKTVIPPAAVMALFERVATPGHLRALNNRAESLTLMALRNTLLPKLLSGELPVTHAESVLEAAV